MTLLLGLAVSLAVVVVVAIGIGLRLDPEHQVQAAAIFDVDIERLYARLSEVDRYALWRTDVSRIEWIGQRATPTWVEHRAAGNFHLELSQEAPPQHREHRLVTELGLEEGSWVFELSELSDAATTRLTVTEKRRLPNPLLRAFYRYCVIADSNILRWLTDLKRSFET